MWNEFIELSEIAKQTMKLNCGEPVTTVHGPHTDIRYKSNKTDLANISIIDMREEKKMWMMHIACFSKLSFPMPVYGFDVICGKNKVTGCFHDMSPTLEKSNAEARFEEIVKPYVPKRERELPPWAKEIFSPYMVIAGATSDEQEIKNLSKMGKENLLIWFDELENRTPSTKTSDYLKSLSKYCTNQLANTNSKNVMISLGLEEDYVNKFKKQQFPY